MLIVQRTLYNPNVKPDVCSICTSKRHSYCNTCAQPGCRVRLHAICARDAGCRFESKPAAKAASLDAFPHMRGDPDPQRLWRHRVFCPKHSGLSDAHPPADTESSDEGEAKAQSRKRRKIDDAKAVEVAKSKEESEEEESEEEEVMPRRTGRRRRVLLSDSEDEEQEEKTPVRPTKKRKRRRSVSPSSSSSSSSYSDSSSSSSSSDSSSSSGEDSDSSADRRRRRTRARKQQSVEERLLEEADLSSDRSHSSDEEEPSQWPPDQPPPPKLTKGQRRKLRQQEEKQKKKAEEMELRRAAREALREARKAAPPPPSVDAQEEARKEAERKAQKEANKAQREQLKAQRKQQKEERLKQSVADKEASSEHRTAVEERQRIAALYPTMAELKSQVRNADTLQERLRVTQLLFGSVEPSILAILPPAVRQTKPLPFPVRQNFFSSVQQGTIVPSTDADVSRKTAFQLLLGWMNLDPHFSLSSETVAQAGDRSDLHLWVELATALVRGLRDTVLEWSILGAQSGMRATPDQTRAAPPIYGLLPLARRNELKQLHLADEERLRKILIRFSHYTGARQRRLLDAAAELEARLRSSHALIQPAVTSVETALQYSELGQTKNDRKQMQSTRQLRLNKLLDPAERELLRKEFRDVEATAQHFLAHLDKSERGRLISQRHAQKIQEEMARQRALKLARVKTLPDRKAKRSAVSAIANAFAADNAAALAAATASASTASSSSSSSSYSFPAAAPSLKAESSRPAVTSFTAPVTGGGIFSSFAAPALAPSQPPAAPPAVISALSKAFPSDFPARSATPVTSAAATSSFAAAPSFSFAPPASSAAAGYTSAASLLDAGAARIDLPLAPPAATLLHPLHAPSPTLPSITLSPRDSNASPFSFSTTSAAPSGAPLPILSRARRPPPSTFAAPVTVPAIDDSDMPPLERS